ncbi:MAG TPA: NAD(P)-dependent oxidoreductase [Chloroflexota bacterium]|jgi:UDP-glucose 4-epimerase|nr:NAD(P)-dependent oxidoreductase [Chloroflexota bacterium]
MKVLVTGATGQVGCRLVRQLLARNHEVRGTVWAGAPEAELQRVHGLDLDLLTGDLADLEFVRRAVAGVEAVIHTANLVGPYFENNVQTTLQVSRACGEVADRLERMIYVSSSGVFPNDSHVLACAYHPVDELHPKRATSEYNLSKLIGEQLTEMTSRRTGLRTVIVRPSHVLSGDKILQQFTVARVVGCLKSGEQNRGSELYVPDIGEVWRQVEAAAEDATQPCIATDLEGRPWYYQPNDARDVAHGLVCALERPEALGESFNLGAPAPFLFPEGARLLAELSGRRPLEMRLPVQWRYDHCINKARAWIGFTPRGDLQAMMRSAWACRQGEAPDYTWD